ncbi:MAG: endopeptidase La [Acidimicrobiales bacterium]|nr:endopeptidase La [Acidimicrobiales bacterium]
MPIADSTPDTPAETRPHHETLPLLPLPDGVVLPDMVVTVTIQSPEARAAIDAATSDRLLLVPRIGSGESARYARVGVVARIEDRATLPDGTPAITVRALHRAMVGTGVIGTGAGLWVHAEPIAASERTGSADETELEQLAREYRAAATTLLDRVGGRRLSSTLRELDDPGNLADSIGYWPDLSVEQRVQLLETVDVAERLRLAITFAKDVLAEIEVRDRIQREVGDDLEKTQREAILRRQLAAIRSELGDGDSDVVTTYRAKLAHLVELDSLDSQVAAAIERELDRLERTGGESMESNWIRTWLDTVFEIPWSERADDQPALADARAVLDADHTGLDEVKDRLIEFLAVRMLRSQRAARGSEPTPPAGGPAASRAPTGSGTILALVGPPGVGKTSLGASVAAALGRPYVRLALGGIRDEAEIRGHRRTYVGARPGRVARALIEAGAMNPVILLDEVDKLGAGWQGDPSAALLEVLDPAQNHSFRDHYLEFELDLSDVVFIATANVLDTIPGPLRDRLEIILLDGYTEAEKASIATDHLIPRLLERNGVEADEVVVDTEATAAIAADYTREAGVRTLERQLDKVIRKSATRLATGAAPPIVVRAADLRSLLGRPVPRDEVRDRIDRPGIATGLAVTGAGGDVLFVEAALVDGEGETVLTGQLGDVMKESAAIARSLVASRGGDWNAAMPTGKRLHVHFPAGAVPKDGPSAGVTMTTALVSLLTDRQVRPEIGMTGEITLQGRVLPIGGVKQKLLAAHRSGLREVIIPAANGPDLDEVPDDVLDQLTVHLASDIGDVLDHALEPVS